MMTPEPRNNVHFVPTRWLTALLCIWLYAAPGVKAQEEAPDADEQTAGAPALGLPPGIPQVSALPGGFTPAYSPGADDRADWGADFHGFLRMPLTFGINQRRGPVTDEQYELVLHAPPRVPEYRDAFTYTSAVGEPYVQLNFGYGNAKVEANVILQARSTQTSASYFDASTRGGIMGVFLTLKQPDLTDVLDLMVHVGAFTNRYGIMGQYDEGRYGTPLLGRTNGVGENVIALFQLGDFNLELQQGFQGLVDAAPLGIVPGDWNDYADANVGTSLVHHYHAGLTYARTVTLGGHYMHAFSADDRANQGTTPDGKIVVAGAELRVTAGRYGHAYLGFMHTSAEHARSVGRVIEVLNGLGGPGLMRSYLGPNSGGTGKLLSVAGQYDLSLARLLYGRRFEGESPDIVFSVFGMVTTVESDDRAYDGVTKLKFGGEGSYSLLKWLAASVRVDEVAPDMSDNDESFVVMSSRIIFRSGWQARDQIVLQYSHWFNGDEVYVRSGSPAALDPNIAPDQHVVSLSASMWW